jgi:hypothetical protein
MTKKAQEIENYLCLISVFQEYEKFTLLEYSENDDNKLVFFNPKNTDLCLKLLKLKEGMDNPYTPMYEWLQEEEIDVEAMIEAITSLNTLNDNYTKLTQKIATMKEDVTKLKSGRSSIKSMFSFKSKADDILNIENNIFNSEKTLVDLEGVIKLATYNMDSYVEYFKVEKLAGYYQHLKIFADLQRNNSMKVNDLWQTVGLDKNVQKLMAENDK